MYKFNQIYIYTHKTLRGIWLEDGREYGWPVKGPNRVKCQTSDGVAGENIALGCWSYTYGPLGMWLYVCMYVRTYVYIYL